MMFYVVFLPTSDGCGRMQANILSLLMRTVMRIKKSTRPPFAVRLTFAAFVLAIFCLRVQLEQVDSRPHSR